jgi:diaminopimelate decarboxylase
VTPHALVAEFGSPLYVYDADEVRRAYRRFRAAFGHSPLDVHYAIVCNPNACLVGLLGALGAGVHANTPGDVHAALAAGVPADRIVYSGTNLSRDDLDYLLGRRIRLNLDSLDQVRDLAARATGTDLGLRLLVDGRERPNRIGVTPDELPAALEIAAAARLRLSGLHMYAGTNTRRVARFLECLDRLIEASALLPDLDTLDLGGGFGVGYREGEAGLDLPELGREVDGRLAALSGARGRRIRLVLEPGRALVAAAGTLLMTVGSVKERLGRRYVGVDSTVGNIVAESVYNAFHRVEAVEPRGEPLAVPTEVCGNTTHSRDYLARSRRLPELRPGDLLALRDVGAYGYAMSSHFLNRPRPAEVVVDGGRARLTTRRETLDDLLATRVLA